MNSKPRSPSRASDANRAADFPGSRSGAPARSGWSHELVLLVIVTTVIAFYFWKCGGAVSELGNTSARDAYYNRLVDGLADGRLDLALPVPEGLKALPDPYDPAASAIFRGAVFEPGRLHDLSYHRGKLYLYFGLTPALLLFWPWQAVTGSYLSHQTAVAFFCAVGFLVSVGVLRAIRARYFPRVPPLWLVPVALVLGLGTSVPAMLSRPDVWEVPISAGYALVALALACVWHAVHDPRARWLWGASVCWGLAVGARPSLLIGTPALVLVVLFRWRTLSAATKRRAMAADVAAMVIPLLMIGGALAAYNYARFGDALEFGQRYQLALDRQGTAEHFSLRYVLFNARLYFLSWVPWRAHFPFWGDAVVGTMPSGHGVVDRPFGILTNTPASLLAFACLWWVRARASQAEAALRAFVAIVAGVFATNAALLCCFYGTCTRYQVDFHPWLGWLACVGLLALVEHAASSTRQRWLVGATLALLTACSAAFGSLRSFQADAELWFLRGQSLARHAQWADALRAFDRALDYEPRLLEPRFQAARACEALGQPDAALARYQELLKIHPAHALSWSNAGSHLQTRGRVPEALDCYRRAVALDPNLAMGHFNLGSALLALQQPEQAADAFRRAVTLDPGSANAHHGLAVALIQLGRLEEAEASERKSRQLNASQAPEVK